MKGFVYKLVDKSDNTPIYVGSTTNPIKNRLQAHKSSLTDSLRLIYRYVREKGISIDIELVEELEINSFAELRKKEKEWMLKLKAEGVDLKNSISPFTNEDSDMTNVRLEHDVIERVRKHVKETKQTIGGFISMVINEKMNKLDYRKSKKNGK